MLCGKCNQLVLIIPNLRLAVCDCGERKLSEEEFEYISDIYC